MVSLIRNLCDRDQSLNLWIWGDMRRENGMYVQSMVHETVIRLMNMGDP